MERITVIIERNNDGSYTAVPQHKHKIGFIGMGRTVAETMSDLENSYKEAREYMPSLPEMSFEYRFDTASFLQHISGRLNLADLQPSRVSTAINSVIMPQGKAVHPIKPSDESRIASGAFLKS